MNTNLKIKTKREKGQSVLNAILESRGIEDKESFLNPCAKEFSNPYFFADMEKAVKIIKNAISCNDKILIWGDFDADGVTSTSILYKVLKHMHANIDFFLPDRKDMGHGINLPHFLTLKAKNNVKVLITVDCGISNAKDIKLIKALGVKVIITDHHEPPETLPEADCILNPLAKNALSPDLSFSDIENISYMSGAGVAFTLGRALLGARANARLFNEILALSAVGTMADVVPLKGENRVIAARGLEAINNSAHKGICAFFKKINVKRQIKSEDIGFLLAPRINAAGRLSTPYDSIGLLIDDNEYSLDTIIEKLNNFNTIRQNLCETVYNEALSMIKGPVKCIVLYKQDWHLGIIGIVASRLVDKFKVPAFLITKDDKNIFRSSIRGCEGFDIAKILKNLGKYFLGCGGHAYAGGFSADPSVIDIETLTSKITEVVADCAPDYEIKNYIEADIELEGKDITKELLDEIDKMEPFGEENPKPVFAFTNAKILSERQIGKDMNHLSFFVLKDDIQFPCLYWKRCRLGLDKGECMDFIFRPELNEYCGEEKIQLICEGIANDDLRDDFSKPIKIFDHRQKTGIMDKIEDYVKVKNGAVKILATSVDTKNNTAKYPSIKENIISEFNQTQKIVMLFDYPPSKEEFEDFIRGCKPEILHFMNTKVIKNPEEYLKLICGMLKFASKNKYGYFSIKALADNSGLTVPCVQTALILLENEGVIEYISAKRVKFVKSPSRNMVFQDSIYEEFKDEVKLIVDFKEYLQTCPVEQLEQLCKI